MKQTIYVDVLIIINIYINYGLMLLTHFTLKIKPDRLKILFASLFGGIYSLVILVPDVSDLIVSLSRVPGLLIMVLLGFGFNNIKAFSKASMMFLLINIIFAGVMFALWYLFAPENMYFNSGVAYFDVDAFSLVALTAAAYLVIRVFSYLTKSKLPVNLTYDMSILFNGHEYSCRAFLDTGNSLTDPFSGEGVTVVSCDVFGEDYTFSAEAMARENIRYAYIPVKTVCSAELLVSVRAERIVLKGIEDILVLDKPLIAVCNNPIRGGEYGALLNSSVFENGVHTKGENYVLHTRKNI